ncbi:hypothetical protein KC359_g14 [Hortaea werneckii]|nr:hypothetical protein KC359_g14 [Hortaea werneckii]
MSSSKFERGRFRFTVMQSCIGPADRKHFIPGHKWQYLLLSRKATSQTFRVSDIRDVYYQLGEGTSVNTAALQCGKPLDCSKIGVFGKDLAGHEMTALNALCCDVTCHHGGLVKSTTAGWAEKRESGVPSSRKNGLVTEAPERRIPACDRGWRWSFEYSSP